MKRLPEYNKRLSKNSLVFVLIVFGYYASAQNLIADGSMEGGIQRSDTVAPGWFKYGPEQPYLNTPDLNGATGILHCSPGYSWWGGTPVASPDGGTWQNVWRIERFAQTVYGLTIGTRYYFRYYYASQGISDGPPQAPASFPYPPDVTIIGATGYTNPSSSKLFEWNTYSGSLVATSDSITIICSEGLYDGYIAYDGFYLGTNQPNDFLEVSAPDSVTLCGVGDASFSVQPVAGVSYQWQSGLGYTWTDVIDGGGVSGSLTNTLLFPNVSAALNKTQYRCRVTSSCCTAVSAPALLLVVPPPNPALKINADVPDICGLASIVVSTDSFYHDYRWNDNSKSLNLLVTQPGIYWVEVTDSNNCKGRDSIEILPCEKFGAPNAFSPNGDGLNDVFKPLFNVPVVNYKLSIYNRWGQLVFQSADPGRGWDGTMDGIALPPDAYVWNCKFRLQGNKEEDKRGTVVLVR